MLTDVADLEQLLAQYDPGRVLVGPLLNLQINASYCYFHLAGNGSKVYESIGLGFIENETHAQKQRTEIIQKLKLRFAEVMLFDSYTEMARAVHAQWATEETIRVLAAAEQASNAGSSPSPIITYHKPINEVGDAYPFDGDESQRLRAGELPEHHQSVPLTDETGDDGVRGSERHRSNAPNQGGQFAAEPATASECTKIAGQENSKSHSYENDSVPENCVHQLPGAPFDDSPDEPDRTAGATAPMTELQRAARRSSNEETAKAAYQPHEIGSEQSKDSNEAIGNRTRGLFEYAARDEVGSMGLPPAPTLPPLANECCEAPRKQKHRDLGLTHDDIASAILKLASPAQRVISPSPAVEPSRKVPESPAIVPIDSIEGGSESVPMLPVTATRGWSTVLRRSAVIPATVFFCTFMPQGTSQKVNAVDNALMAVVTNVPPKSAAAAPLPVSQPAYVGGSAQKTEAAVGKIHTPAASSSVKNGTVNAAPVSESQQPQVATAGRSEAEQIAKLVNRGMESLKHGDLERARLSLQRAVEAIPNPTAPPAQVQPSKPTNPLAAKLRGPQDRQSPPIKSLAGAPRETQVASVEARIKSANAQKMPTQEDRTIRRLDPNDMAVLLSRGMDFLNSGDFASARVTLRRAAEAGNAEAALALGSTYDPSVLRQFGAITIAADIVQAREWYEKALRLGSAAAAHRLATLAQPAR
jgi:TPR repeat protein